MGLEGRRSDGGPIELEESFQLIEKMATPFLAVHVLQDGRTARDSEGKEITYPLNPGATVCAPFKKTGRCPKFNPGCEMQCAYDHPSKAECRRRDMAALTKYQPNASAAVASSNTEKQAEAARRQQASADREAQRQEKKRLKAEEEEALRKALTVIISPP